MAQPTRVGIVGGVRGAVAELVEEAGAWREQGRLAEARAAYARAAEAARAVGDDEAFVAAALGVGGLWVYEQRDVVERARLEDLWREAARLAEPGSLGAARLGVRRAAEAVYEGGPPAAVWAAADTVRAFGDDAASAEALSLLHHVLLGPHDAERRLGVAEEIVRLAVRAGDGVLALQGLCWRTVDLFLAGDSRALQSHAELVERAEGCDAIAFVADAMAAMLHARAGRFDAAEAISGAAFARGVTAGDPDAPAYFGAQLATLRWWQGRAGEIVDVVRASASSPRVAANDHVYVAADALLSAVLGDTDAAEEALARLPMDRMTLLETSSSWLTTQFLVVEAAFLLGRADIAGEAAGRLHRFAQLPVMPSLAVVCFGSAERSLGLASATAGDLDAAVGYLEAAVEDDRRLGNRPMRVLTEHVLAGILRARGRPEDAARASALAAQAQERAARYGLALGALPEWLLESQRHAAAHSARTDGPRSAVFESVPGGWRIAVGDRGTVLSGRVGLTYLAALLGRPGQDHEVADLATGVPAAIQPVLDEQAVASYRRRAKELEVLLDDGLPDAAEQRIRGELRDIADALRAATGLGGRRRRFPDSHERARTAVRKALVRAIEAVAAVEPDLGDHLRASITTGSVCRYAPRPGWSVSVVRKS